MAGWRIPPNLAEALPRVAAQIAVDPENSPNERLAGVKLLMQMITENWSRRPEDRERETAGPWSLDPAGITEDQSELAYRLIDLLGERRGASGGRSESGPSRRAEDEA